MRGVFVLRVREFDPMSSEGDSDSGQRRDTHRGLGEVEASFTPSDSDELRPSFDPAFPNGAPEHDVRLPSSPRVPDIEDLTAVTSDGVDRRLFDTSMGGGSNRVSGGREAARAYVAPRTPRPVLFHSQDTLSIEVAERNNQFDTVPSLSKRKLSRLLGESIPGLESRPSERGVNLWFVVGLALFGGIFLVFLANREEPEPRAAMQPAADPKLSKPTPSKPALPQESAPKAAAAAPAVAPEAPSERPVPATKATEVVQPSTAEREPAPPPSAASTARPATSSSKKVTAPAKSVPAKSQSKSSKSADEDLWLD